jgi:Xaa-Pro aminopeptidase
VVAGVVVAGVGAADAGAMPDETGIPDQLAAMVYQELRERGLHNDPVGMDVPDMTTLLALQRTGLEILDSQPVMLEARKIKSPEELALLESGGRDGGRVRHDLPDAPPRRR